MIADYNNMPEMYWECNSKYFDHSLPTPRFGLMKKLKWLARFEYMKNKKGKHPIKRQTILFSEYYDFDEEVFRNLMVHEMIHYWRHGTALRRGAPMARNSWPWPRK